MDDIWKKIVREIPENIAMIDPMSISRAFVRALTAQGIPISKAFLYGSHAKGTATSYSDIDVCIVSPQFGKDLIDEMVALRQISRLIDDRIEPLPFGLGDITDPYDPLAAEIRRFGHPIVA